MFKEVEKLEGQIYLLLLWSVLFLFFKEATQEGKKSLDLFVVFVLFKTQSSQLVINT